jgi:crossover junction endodeoxyribonuclease RuvC
VSPVPPERRILGLDPGSLATGWGVIGVSGSQLRCLDSGVIRPDRKAPLAERLRQLHDEVTGVIATTRPEEAAIEEVYVARNARTALVLGHARGVIMLACVEHGLQPHEYSANTVKQAVLGTGGGGASKERVAYMVKALLGLDRNPEPDDISDALACAICHANRREVPG